MRVAIVLNASWNVVNFRMGLLQGLKSAGHEIVVFAPRDAYSSRIPFEFIDLPMQAKGRNPFRDLFLVANIFNVFRKKRPDVVLTFTPKPNIYGAIAARLLGIPCIANVAGLGTMYSGSRVSRNFMRLLYRVAFRSVRWVFFQNEEDKADFISHEIVPIERCSRIYGSGIDLERFSPGARIVNEVPVFLLVSRLLWEKGVGDFAEAARQFKRSGLSASFRIVGILDEGNPKAVSRSELESWEREGILEFLGPAEDVRESMNASDCVVLPSTYREGVPRVLIEAAALGKPLVAYQNVGVGDIVRDGENGFLVRPRDTRALVQALKTIVEMPYSDRERLGKESRRIAEECFDERVIVSEYLQAITLIAGIGKR